VWSARRLYNLVICGVVLGEFQMKPVPDEGFSDGSEVYKSSEEEESPSPYEEFKCDVKTLCVL
jgi:hypothetical protein